MVENLIIQNLLQIYEVALSEQINRPKTLMTLSNNVKLKVKKKITDFWSSKEQQQPDKHLSCHLWLAKDK